MVEPIPFGDGACPDVCCVGDGWLLVYRVMGGPLELVLVDGGGREVGRLSIDTGSPEGASFARLVTWRSRQFLGFPSFRNGTWVAEIHEVTNLTLGPTWPAGPVHNPDHPYGNNAVCLSSDGWFAWQDFDTLTVEGLWLANGEYRTLRDEVRPTGLSRVDGGQAVFIDEDRAAVPGMFNPVWAGDAIVGEDPIAGIQVRVPDRAGVLLPGADAMTPRVATDGLGHYAAVTWGTGGVRLVLFTAADVVAPQPAQIPTIGRPLWLGWFAIGAAGDVPGNCLLAVGDDMVVRDMAGSTVASFAVGTPDGDVDALDRAVIAARQRHPHAPVLGYWTAAAQNVRPPFEAEYPAIEAYRHVGESLPDLRARVVLAIAAVSGRDVFLVAQCYTSNTGNDPDLASLVPFYAQLAHDYLGIRGVLVFSAGSRATGWNDHPEVHDAWRQLAAGITGPPPIERPHAPDPGPRTTDPGPQTPNPIPTPKPQAPKPTPPFAALSLFSFGGHMTTERGGLVGPSGKFARIAVGDAGHGLFRWFAVHFDADAPNGDAAFDLEEVAPGRFRASHVATGCTFGSDMTKFSGDLTKQFYGKPPAAGDPGDYETPYGFDDGYGARILMVRYNESPDVPHAYWSTPVSWVKA